MRVPRRTLTSIVPKIARASSARVLRALVVTPIYPWAGLPSEGIFVHRQVQRLVKAGVDCRVIMFRPAVRGLPHRLKALSWLRYHPRWTWWPPTLEGIRVDVVFYPTPLRRGSDLVPAAAQAVGRHLQSHPELRRVDVVYAHWLWQGGAVALAVRDQLSAPVVAIARGSDVDAWLSVHPHCRPHVERVLRHADLVLANCHALRRRARSIDPDGVDPQIEVVYNGCDTSSFRPAADVAAIRRRLGIPTNDRIFLCCCNLKQRKGLLHLAEAWELVAAQPTPWRLIVIGAFSEAAVVDRLREAGRRTGMRVELRGVVSSEQVVEYMQACDALVHPSLAEGVANATLEAMSTGVPVISTDVDGQPEIIQDGRTGILVPPGDPRALADALLRVANRPAYARRLGAAARQRVLEHFDAEQHGRRLAAILERAARQPRPERALDQRIR